jgi:PIN domain nuclease of toxin-antitoxin system
MNYIADTHVLLWWFTDSPKISRKASEIFKKINDSENFVIIALDYPILEKMVALKEIPELHDKIIASA